MTHNTKEEWKIKSDDFQYDTFDQLGLPTRETDWEKINDYILSLITSQRHQERGMVIREIWEYAKKHKQLSMLEFSYFARNNGVELTKESHE